MNIFVRVCDYCFLAGVCDGDLVEDCAGECGGISVEDECGVFELLFVLLFTLSFINFPTLKTTTFLAGTKASSPVRGFLAFLAALFLTSNTPKSLNSIRLPCDNSSTILSRNI